MVSTAIGWKNQAFRGNSGKMKKSTLFLVQQLLWNLWKVQRTRLEPRDGAQKKGQNRELRIEREGKHFIIPIDGSSALNNLLLEPGSFSALTWLPETALQAKQDEVDGARSGGRQEPSDGCAMLSCSQVCFLNWSRHGCEVLFKGLGQTRSEWDQRWAPRASSGFDRR